MWFDMKYFKKRVRMETIDKTVSMLDLLILILVSPALFFGMLFLVLNCIKLTRSPKE